MQHVMKLLSIVSTFGLTSACLYKRTMPDLPGIERTCGVLHNPPSPPWFDAIDLNKDGHCHELKVVPTKSYNETIIGKCLCVFYADSNCTNPLAFVSGSVGEFRESELGTISGYSCHYDEFPYGPADEDHWIDGTEDNDKLRIHTDTTLTTILPIYPLLHLQGPNNDTSPQTDFPWIGSLHKIVLFSEPHAVGKSVRSTALMKCVNLDDMMQDTSSIFITPETRCAFYPRRDCPVEDVEKGEYFIAGHDEKYVLVNHLTVWNDRFASMYCWIIDDEYEEEEEDWKRSINR